MPVFPVFEAPCACAAAPPAQWHLPVPTGGAALPREGGIAYTASGRAIQLMRKIGGTSGEGEVYCDRQGCCVKLFHPASNTILKQQRLLRLVERMPALMLANRGLCRRIALPATPVYADAQQQRMIGYQMPYFAECVPLYKAAHHAGKQTRMALARSVAELAAFAAAQNLILGDTLTLYNLLYHPKTCAVYAIDLDSTEFFAGDMYYPALAGRAEYESPERIGSTPPPAMRTAADDAWALQMVLFLLLMGFEPYLRLHSDSLSSDVQHGTYAFPRGIAYESPYQLPGGTNGRCAQAVLQWPAPLRELFWQSFSGSGMYFHAAARLTAADWLARIAAYA